MSYTELDQEPRIIPRAAEIITKIIIYFYAKYISTHYNFNEIGQRYECSMLGFYMYLHRRIATTDNSYKLL